MVRIIYEYNIIVERITMNKREKQGKKREIGTYIIII